MTAPHRHRAIVAAYIEAYNDFDLDTLARMMHEDAVLVHHNRGICARGLPAILAQYRRTHTLMPNRRFLLPRTVETVQDCAFVTHRFVGTVSAEPLRPDAELQLDLLTVFRFRGPRISEYHDYG